MNFDDIYMVIRYFYNPIPFIGTEIGWIRRLIIADEMSIFNDLLATSGTLFKIATFASRHFFSIRAMNSIRELPTAIADTKCSKRN